MDTVTYLDRVLEPVVACLTPEVAARLVELRTDPELQYRIDELVDRCMAGTLTDEERAEYETYVRAGGFLAQLQTKARKLLESANPG